MHLFPIYCLVDYKIFHPKILYFEKPLIQNIHILKHDLPIKIKNTRERRWKNITLAINWSMLKIATNMRKTIGKILSGKYSHKQFNHAKQSATDALKTALKRAIQKTA